MSIFVRTILLFAALLAAPFVQAVGLGDITGTGAIGEHLDARVSLYLAPGERATLKDVEVLPDMFARSDSTPIESLRASLVADGSRTYVQVSSTAPITVERLRFRLRVNGARGAVIARYALRALPAVRSIAGTPERSAAAPRIVTRSPALVAASETAQADLSRYGPVRRGESLWTIAQGFASEGQVTSIMQRLHAANPSAFINGDINRLRAGVMLALPADLSATATTSSNAATTTTRAATKVGSEDEVAANSSSVDARASTSAVSTSTADALDSTDGARSELDTLLNEAAAGSTDIVDASSPANSTLDVQAPRATSSDGGTNTATVARPRDDALTLQLAALDAKFAAIRARYGEAPSSTAVATKPKLVDATTTRAPATLPPSPVLAPDKPIPAAPPIDVQPGPGGKPDAAAAATDAEAALPWWLPAAGLALLLALLLLAAWPRLSGRLVASRTRARVASVKADDAGLKAEVARKAENRVRLESEIQGLLRRKSTTAAVAAAPRPAIAPAPLAETTHPPVSPFEQTLDPLAITSGGALLENDREVAIDANIAHGRYAEAEVLLRETIRTHPRNVQAKLRLAEVYYITEKLEGFATVATDIKDHHRGDLTDEEWQRVVRMGKIIAPDLALFSGPKAVGKRA